MTLYPVACTVYSNYTQSGAGCGALFGQYVSVGFATQIIIALGLGLAAFGALFITRVYFEYPLGRLWWKRKATKAILHLGGQPGIAGLLYHYTEDFFLFVSGGKGKDKTTRLIPAMSGAITHLRKEDGGDSFVLIDGDKGAPVNPEVMEWAEKHLNELAQSHDWSTFALKVRYGQVVDAITRAAKFPVVKDWKPGDQQIVIVKADNSEETKKAKDATADERQWYENVSKRSFAIAQDAEMDRRKIVAALNGEKEYLGADGKTMVQFFSRDLTEFVSKITHELAKAQGNIANAVIGGKVITTQYVASVLDNYPDGIAFDSERASIEKKVADEMRKRKDDLLKNVIIALIAIGGIVAIIVVAGKFL